MYCTRCGKQIDYDAMVCNECAAKANGAQPVQQPQPTPTYQQPVYQPQAQPKPQPSYFDQFKGLRSKGNVMDGFGGALASTIMGFLSLISLCIGLVSFIEEPAIGGGLLLMIVSLVLGIIALVKGIGGIKGFVLAGKLKKVRPIPALILGIAGIVLSGLSLLYMLIFLIALFGAL